MVSKNFDPKKFYFSDISFKLLMKKRINNILVISSAYDYFILEEDGRIDEQIFNEYTALGLNYPPQFFHAGNESEAFSIIPEKNIDLIIIMPGSGFNDASELADKIKLNYPNKPIVLLTPFSREVSLKLSQRSVDLNKFDYVFCWLGHAEILLAIAKLIEDKLNVEFDVREVGIQTIILVENSIRFYSSYLPNIYKLIFKQSKEFMTEGLNAHQQMLRLRGRPKILLATNYEEAVELYEKYKNNLLGVISDVSFDMQGVRDTEAGIKLAEKIRNENPFIPILLQSTNIKYKKIADELKIGFLSKQSKILSLELRDYFIRQFAFGDFIFRNPVTFEEVDRAHDLHSLQHKIKEIPEDSFIFHVRNNHISKWLKARAFFEIARFFEPIKIEDFKNINEIRQFLFDAIADYRLRRIRGFIVDFKRENFDEYFLFSRIGEESIGGKARGLAFMDLLIKSNHLLDKYPDILITIPRTVVLATDIYDEFMEKNNLYKITQSDLTDEEILQNFIKALLPSHIQRDLFTYVSVIKTPVAIRSSSLLEDSFNQPFAGIYKTYMIPCVHENKKLMVEMLNTAIKSVYASMFYKTSKAYMTATSNIIGEEKMAVVIQEVCGAQHDDKFYPSISGVARSIDYYPVSPAKAEDGVANIAFGLGKYILDGGLSLRFSPKYPQKIIQLSSIEAALKETQKNFYALDLNKESFKISTNESVNILKLPVKAAENDNTLRDIASTFDLKNNIIRDGINQEGKRLITFSNILKHNVIPLADILKTLLDIGKRELNNHVEIEFAVNFDTLPGEPKIFNVLQIRPIIENKDLTNVDLTHVSKEETIIYSQSAFGNGIFDQICDIVYIKTENYNSARNNEITGLIEKLNEQFISEGRNFILIGPGRWGSNDPWLGIPVKWQQISAARIIVESGLENYRIDPSQGTHFFFNLTSLGVGYFTINPFINEGFYDLNYLSGCKAFYEDDLIRHIRVKKPFIVKIDGRKGIGVILKP